MFKIRTRRRQIRYGITLPSEPGCCCFGTLVSFSYIGSGSLRLLGSATATRDCSEICISDAPCSINASNDKNILFGGFFFFSGNCASCLNNIHIPLTRCQCGYSSGNFTILCGFICEIIIDFQTANWECQIVFLSGPTLVGTFVSVDCPFTNVLTLRFNFTGSGIPCTGNFSIVFI